MDAFISSIVAFADAVVVMFACRKLSWAGFFLSASPSICWRRVDLDCGFAEGGAGKSEALFMDGGGLRFFFVALATLALLCIEGKSEVLFIDGGGADPKALC